MTVIQIAPDGVPAEFVFEVAAPADASTIEGVRLHFSFELERPSFFEPHLYLNDVRQNLAASAVEPLSVTFARRLAEAVQAPARARLVVNEEGHLEPGNSVTIYAGGFQDTGDANTPYPGQVDDPNSLTDVVEVGQVQVLSWLEWKRITGENQGQPTGS